MSDDRIFGGGSGNNFGGIVRLTADAKVRTVKTKKGPQKVCDLRFANSPSHEKGSPSLFLETTIWGEGGVTLFSTMKKGDPLLLLGGTMTEARTYERNNGETGVSLVIKDARFSFVVRKGAAAAAEAAETGCDDTGVTDDGDLGDLDDLE